MGSEAGPAGRMLSRLAGNKIVLILVGGALGSYLRYWLPTQSMPASLGPLVGGALGSYLRFWLSRWFNNRPWGQVFPYGTLVVNVVGSFALAAASVIVLEVLGPAHQGWYLLIGTGFCGGLTTFSTFELETFRLARDGSWRLALGNVFVNLGGTLLAVMAAVVLLGWIVAGQPVRQVHPGSTLVINLSGSFLLGVAFVVLLERLPPAHQNWYMLLGTGFCGGYTTFSLFAWETFVLIRTGALGLALGNALGSVLAGFLSLLAGVMLVNRIFPRKVG